MNKLNMASISFNNFQFVFSFSFNFSFSFKVQMCSDSCLQFSEGGQVTGDRLKEWDLFAEWFQLMVQFRTGRIPEKFGSHRMGLALGLRGFFATSLGG